ncbi:MAG: magnesium transporter [Candidatus Krumholzibacteriia bacterium]
MPPDLTPPPETTDPARRQVDLAAAKAAIRHLLDDGRVVEAAARLADLHPSDAADLLEDLPGTDERVSLVEELPPAAAAAALAEIDPEAEPERILGGLDPAFAGRVVARLASDDAADLLGQLRSARRRAVLAAVPGELARGLRDLLRYPEDSAGGIMSTELLAVPASLSAGEAAAEVRRQARRIGEVLYQVFVTDEGGLLQGVLGLHELVLADPATPLRELAASPAAMVGPDADQEEAARRLHHYDLPSLPVVQDGRLLGHVTWDDVMDVLEEEQTEDILRLAGTDPAESVRGDWAGAVRGRLPWLFVNLGTGALAALVVYLYQDTIDQLVILAAIMPLIAGLGGNAGTQALAVTVRRLTLDRDVGPERWRVAGKELLVGFTNGAVLGLVVGAVGLVWQGSAVFGLVVLLAMWGNLVVASFAGALVPVVLDGIGVDPAVASAVFVTTFTDLAGFFLLLGLASAWLV